MKIKLKVFLLFHLLGVMAACQSSPQTIPTAPVVTDTPLIEPTANRSETREEISVKMVFVPAGEFLMGSETGDADESPVHSVYLDAFYIDMFEVPKANYHLCVDAGDCSPPVNTGSSTRASYNRNSAYDDFPIMYVSWDMAQAYCEWRGVELPSEAQ